VLPVPRDLWDRLEVEVTQEQLDLVATLEHPEHLVLQVLTAFKEELDLAVLLV
jgi:hypothetical protein